MKRKALKWVILLLVCANLIRLFTPSAIAQPQPPCVFYGYVTVGGKPAKDGLNVTAIIAGTVLKWATETKNGTYGWPVKGSSLFTIPSDSPDTSEKDGGVTGDIVQFYVNEIKIDRTATFESAAANEFDLSIPTSGLQQSTVTVSLDCSATYTGYKVKMSGKLAYTDGAGISGANLFWTYSATGGEPWNMITSFNTTTNGNYYAEWTPNATGDYLIKVSWEGSENVAGTEAYTNLAVTPIEEKYVFSVISNSTISELAFNSTSNALSFTLYGPSGTTGYTNVTIATDLIAEITGLKVYLDENQVDYTATSGESSWLLHFTYQHSAHKVIVSLNLPMQPFFETPLGIATLSAIIVAIVIAIICVFRFRAKRPEKPKPMKSRLKSQRILCMR